MKSVILMTALMASLSIQPQDFNTELVAFLAKTTNTPLPTKIEIEVVSQAELQSSYRAENMAGCMQATDGNFPYCATAVQNIRTFIFGHWLKRDGPEHLHIVLYEKAGPEVLVHEFMHYKLHYMTNPPGLLNREDLVEEMMKLMVSSKEFVEWLGGAR